MVLMQQTRHTLGVTPVIPGGTYPRSRGRERAAHGNVPTRIQRQAQGARGALCSAAGRSRSRACGSFEIDRLIAGVA